MWRWALRGVSLSAALSIVVACAKGDDGIDVGDGGIVEADSGPPSTLPDGGGSTGKDSSPPDPQDSGGGGCTGKVLINELQPNGTGNAEFVELYNPNTCAVSLTGWKLLYRAENGNPGLGLKTFAAGDSIPAKELLVFANASFSGAKNGPLTGGMGNAGGQVGLVNDVDKLIDAVGYGTGTAGLYTEGSPAALPTGNASIARKSDGLDTDNNASDFKVSPQHTAGASNN